ncbi:MAG TPA: hypothetical protein VHL34_22295 [Rhizomicrobium sp.]|jgi:hypothetical protein|nr:hypothetical protein [Rhizomicrobium sp.]
MTLLDAFLPVFQFRERHSVVIAATPARIFEALSARDLLGDDRIVRAMLAVRSAPAVLWQKLRAAPPPANASFGMHSFVPLGRDGDREMASGLAGRFWRPDGGLHVFGESDAVARAEAFRRFAEPGVAKLVLGFACVPDGPNTVLSTETRVCCPDLHSRVLFTPYWYAIRLGSGFIRMRMLRAVKRVVESYPQTPMSSRM